MEEETRLNLITILRGIIKVRWLFLFGLFVLDIITQETLVPRLNFVHLLLGAYCILNTIYYIYLFKKEECNLNVLKILKFCQICLDPIFFTIIIYYSGGIANHAHTLYFISIIITSILYQTRVVIIELLYCSTLYVSVVLLEHFHYLPPVKMHFSSALHFNGTLQEKLYDTANIIFIFWVVGILAIYLLKMLYKREDQITAEKNKTRATIEALNDGLIVFDPDFKISIVNKRTEEIFKIKKEELENKYVGSIHINTPLRVFLNLALEAMQKQKKVFLREVALKNKETSKTIQTSLVPILDKENNRLGVVQIFHDISREKAIDAMKSEFIAIAAHQLRTPLSIIKWTLDMILKGEMGHISLKSKKYLQTSYTTNEWMIALVNDLLNVTKIEEGRFGYKIKLEKIDEIIMQVVESLRKSSILKAKELIIELQKPKEKLPCVKIDKNRLIMALQNLIDNAIKYSKQKTKIIVKIKIFKKEIRISVQNQGVGISPDEQKKLFSKFFRGAQASRIEAHGSGLGLFITRNIINAHGGRIWFKSKQEQGTTFTFSLPMAEFFKFKKSHKEFEKFLKDL